MDTDPRGGADEAGRAQAGSRRSQEIHIIARFHALGGNEGAVEQAIREVQVPTRKEPGCLGHQFYRSIRDTRLFFIHSHFMDEAAFTLHAGLQHTVRFIETVEKLIDHPLDVNRTEQIG